MMSALEVCGNKVVTYRYCVRTKGLSSGYPVVVCISSDRCVDHSAKNDGRVGKRHSNPRNTRMQPRKEHLPYHSESTVVRIFTEEPDGCRVAWLTQTTTRKKKQRMCSTYVFGRLRC